MKTTRRHLLSLLGLGAAAACPTVGASAAAAAAPKPMIRNAMIQMPLPADLSGIRFENCTFYDMGAGRMDNSVTITGRNVATGYNVSGPVIWSNVFATAEEIAVIVPIPERVEG